MSIADRRADSACLPPILIDDFVDDPGAVLALAQRTGPYRFPDRPGGFIWPTWHAQWAVNGEVLEPEAESLLHNPDLIAAAAQMYDSDRVVPQGLYVNLGTPWIAQPVMHTDLPNFRGISETVVPGWFLQAMGTSRLFEAERINLVTAVTWFYAGTNGGFRYWPDGPAGESVAQSAMWNTAIVGDNDFMFHKVERIGPDGTTSPDAMTSATELDHDGEAWVVSDGDAELGRYPDEHVRLSVSWKALVLDDQQASVGLDETFARMSAALGGAMVATSPSDLFDEPSRLQLMAQWPGFIAG